MKNYSQSTLTQLQHKARAILLCSITLCLLSAVSYAQSETSLLAANSINANSLRYLHIDTALQPEKVHTMRDVPWFVEKFKLSLGVFFPVNNTDIKVSNVHTGNGTDLDFEDDLGFNKNSTTFLADFQWRSSSRSRFDLSYYRINRSSDYSLKKDITFGDHTYNINSSVNAFFNTSIYRFSYGYAILSKPTYEAGLLVGAHVVKANLGIGLNGENLNLAYSDDLGFTAPLPDFGLWGGVSLSDRFALNGEADYLSLKIGDIWGRILGFNFLATYKVLPNLQLSAGYTGLNFKVDVTKTNLEGNLKWGYNGPNITAAFTFGRKSWQ
ncbi:hypothetical protein [Mucilaginibacter agri]|uniref:DUF4421 domain-containing protein n=1 Tax=Mucilaginibacter agri TaxID=2695265 RepID=A0A966DU30_9SPHI|nr:hypothetical protein [Mucilaginibacter agri]NCD71948.1 hypothetical protein [Mucilaginibacter agri]